MWSIMHKHKLALSSTGFFSKVQIFFYSWKSDSACYGNREGEISKWESDGPLDSSGVPGISEQSSSSGQSSTHCPARDVKDKNPGLRGRQAQVGCRECWLWVSFSPLHLVSSISQTNLHRFKVFSSGLISRSLKYCKFLEYTINKIFFGRQILLLMVNIKLFVQFIWPARFVAGLVDHVGNVLLLVVIFLKVLNSW